MAKKRDHRRESSESNRRQSRLESSSTGANPTTDSASQNDQERKLIIIFFFFFVILPAVSVLVYRIKFGPTTERTLLTVYERGLVRPNVNYKEILIESSKVSENRSRRHYTYPVLAYITPWNSRGYDYAKMFNSKFTHLSPVWYDLKSQGPNLVLEGRHNADLGWISELKLRGDARVLPRVVLEALPKELLRKKKQRNKAIELIVTECQAMEYDGIVLESWSRWAAYGILHDPDMRNRALDFIKQLGEALHSARVEKKSGQQLQLVYVIGPPHSEKIQEHDFGPKDLQRLGDAVDGFSLMTYDYSGPHNPGPNAPMKWIHSTLELLLADSISGAQTMAQKIFLGINFYGNDFKLSGGPGGGAITGRDYLALLEQHRPVLQWEKDSAEHFFVYSDHDRNKHAVFYPSLMSISVRLEETQSWQVGISIWEIGQGLDYFFDLL